MLSSVLEHEARINKAGRKGKPTKQEIFEKIQMEKKTKVDHSDAEDVIAMKANKGLLILP